MCLNNYRISQDEILTNCLTNFNADRLQIGNPFWAHEWKECCWMCNVVWLVRSSEILQLICKSNISEAELDSTTYKWPQKNTNKFTRDWLKTKQLKFLDWVKAQISRITWNRQRMLESPHISSKEQCSLLTEDQ